MSYSPHIEALSQMTPLMLLFDTMKNSMVSERESRPSLQVAAILHDCGKYISFANAPQCAYDIIMSSEIMGLSHLEREIVAGTVLYNSYPLADYEDVADRLDQQSFLTGGKVIPPFCAFPMRWIAATNRSLKT